LETSPALAKVIGLLASVDLNDHIDKMGECLDEESTNPNLKRTLAIAFKYTATPNNTTEMRMLLDDFMTLLKANDGEGNTKVKTVNVKTEAFNSFAYLGKNFPKIIKYKINDNLLLGYMESMMPF
jgi:hypothetical protein